MKITIFLPLNFIKIDMMRFLGSIWWFNLQVPISKFYRFAGNTWCDGLRIEFNMGIFIVGLHIQSHYITFLLKQCKYLFTSCSCWQMTDIKSAFSLLFVSTDNLITVIFINFMTFYHIAMVELFLQSWLNLKLLLGLLLLLLLNWALTHLWIDLLLW